MLLSYKNKFIFIHILKTAGTSVSKRFATHARFIDSLVYGYLPTEKLFIAFNILLGRKGIELVTGFHKHATAAEIRKKLPDEMYNNFFKFCFVRNPWDFCVSLYFYLSQNSKLPDHKVVRRMCFPEFVEWYTAEQPKRQIDYIVDANGDFLVDFIGKYETLEDDIRCIADKLSLNIKPLPHKNVSTKRKSKDYRLYYDSNTIDSVARYFKKDIEVFDYQFE